MTGQVAPGSLDIELASGETLTSLTPADYWPMTWPMPETPADPTQPIHLGDLLREDHHRYYGRPWILGRFYFDFLRRCGLKPADNVLDFGCGSGRVGLHLIPYLESGRYCGLDSHLKSLVAFARYEAPLHDLAPKKPRLMLDNRCSVENFGVAFDVILDFATSYHFKPDIVTRLYKSFFNILSDRGRIFMPHEHRLSAPALAELGFTLSEEIDVSYPLLAHNHKQIPIDDHWRIYTKRS